MDGQSMAGIHSRSQQQHECVSRDAASSLRPLVQNDKGRALRPPSPATYQPLGHTLATLSRSLTARVTFHSHLSPALNSPGSL